MKTQSSSEVGWRRRGVGLLVGVVLSAALAGTGQGETPANPESGARIKAAIAYPLPNDRVRGLVPIYGVADAEDFKEYRLDFGEGDAPTKWETVTVSRKPQPRDPHAAREIRWDPNYGARGNLGDWEVGPPSYDYSTWKRNLNGRYTLRLVVEDKQGRQAEHRVTVNVGQLLTRLEGGTVSSPDGRLRLTAPPLSVGYGDFAVVCLFPAKGVPVPDGYQALGPVYELNPPNFQVIQPMRLAMSYRAEELDFDRDRQPDVPEERVGLYYWSPVEQVWVRYRNQERPSAGTVVATFTGSTERLACIGLLADTKPPDPPLLVVKNGDRPLARNADDILKSPSPWVDFLGKAEPDSLVRLIAGGNVVAETDADMAGRFQFPKRWVDTDLKEFRAQAVDRSGQTSPPSGTLKCQWSPAPCKAISSLSVLGPKECSHGDWVVVKAVADMDAAVVDEPPGSLSVSVNTVVSDAQGIRIEMRPVSGRQGTFVGSVRIGLESDPAVPRIAARKHEEMVQFRMAKDPRATAEIPYKDRTGPEAPVITSQTHPSVLHAWFGQGDAGIVSTTGPKQGWSTIDGSWGGRTSVRDWASVAKETETADLWSEGKADGATAIPSRDAQRNGAGSGGLGPGVSIPERKADEPSRYIHVKPTPRFPSHLGLQVPIDVFDVRSFPLISFDYRFHPKLALDLLLRTDRHGWKGIRLAGTHPPLFEQLAAPVGLKADNQWHHADLSLDRILRNAYPTEDDWRIEEMRFQCWSTPSFKSLDLGISVGNSHVHYDLARFGLLRYAAGTKVKVKWSAEDLNGIAGYSYVLDQSPWTEPRSLDAPQTETEKTFENVTAGTWFFHVRAADVPGNWGRTAHYELRVSPPQPGTLEFGVPEGKEKVRWPDPLLVRARGCATVIPESLKVTVAGRRFTTADAALQFDQPSGAVSFFPDLVEPDAWIFPAGHRVKMVIDDAAGLDGSALPKPVSFEFTSQSPLALEFPESAGTTNQLPSFTSPIPHAVLPAAWFSSAPRVRLADPPDGSGFRWLPQVEAERDAPGIQSLQLQLPVSWFSEKARLRNPDKDFLPCAWSFGLVPNGTQEDAAVWTPGGLLASYYGPPEKAAETGGATTGPLLARRVDRFVYCVPDDASAMPAVPQATSARWEGMLYVPSTDEWSFEFLLRTTQVKAEMILDGKTVLTTKDQWHPHVVSGRRFLTRGFHAVQIDMTSPRTGWYLEWFWEAEDWYALRRVPPENLFARVPLRAASGKQ